MFLRRVETGHRWHRRLQMRLMPATVGFAANDLIKTLLYRPGFFGRRFLAYAQSVLRGRSFWSQAEREVMASFVSAENQCVF